MTFRNNKNKHLFVFLISFYSPYMTESVIIKKFQGKKYHKSICKAERK